MSKGTIKMIAVDEDGNKIRDDITGVCPAGEVTVHLPSMDGHLDPSPSSRVETVPSGGELTVSHTYNSTGVTPPSPTEPPATGSPVIGASVVEGHAHFCMYYITGNKSLVNSQSGVGSYDHFVYPFTEEHPAEAGGEHHDATWVDTLSALVTPGTENSGFNFTDITWFPCIASIAVPEGHTIKIYSEDNLKGDLIATVVGPGMVVESVRRSDAVASKVYEDWSEPFHSLIPASVRTPTVIDFQSEGMWDGVDTILRGSCAFFENK